MPTYVSRHNPRQQLVALGERMMSVESYDRFYDIGWEALQRGILPLVKVPAGRLLFRFSEATIEQSRTLRAARFSSNSRTVRYSGMRLNGSEGQGALYLGSLGAIVREQVHYDKSRPPTGLVLPGGPDHTRAAVRSLQAGAGQAAAATSQPFHIYRLQGELLMADLRVRSLVQVFQSVLATPAARSRFGLSPLSSATGLMNAVLSPQDYSAARGLADAVHDVGTPRGLAGLVATSARGDSDTGVILDNLGDGVEGVVYALFGAAGARMDTLQPLASYGSFRQMQLAARQLPGFSWVA